MSLIDSLTNPAAYPHPAGSVERHETHISWVFLAGDFAYKIKKPVSLGFLDFSTLDRRRFFCEEEIRLNQRLAPQLYLGVVPIARGTAGNPELLICGPGSPVEYAVKMRRFPQESLLSHVLQRGELRPEHIDSLAEEVSEFHSRADAAPADGAFGGADAVFRPVEECLKILGNDADPADAENLLRVRAWVVSEHAARRDLFEQRKRQGFVRECHGDMHLGNMLLEGNRVTIFDGIEFNDSLRWIDVLSEAAFTAMDLADRGRNDLSARFLNAYLQGTGDYAGLGVLRFYTVYRALVRAKVAGIRLRQPGLSGTDRAELNDERRSYVQLALTFTQVRRPMLLLTHGVSGSGKSTWTQPLLERLHAIRIRSDVERKRMHGLRPTEQSGSPADGGLYSGDVTEATYARLADLSRHVLDSGRAAIVDATFLARRQRDRFRNLAREMAAGFAILDVRVPEAVLRRRVAERARAGDDASEATVEVLEQQLRTHEPLGGDELADVIPIDATECPTADRIQALVAEAARAGSRLSPADAGERGRG